MRVSIASLFAVCALSCARQPAAPVEEIGLSSSRTEAASNPAPAATSTAPVTQRTPAPIEDVEKRFPGQTVDTIASWTRALGSEDVLAVLVTENRPGAPVRSLSWFRASESGEVYPGRSHPVSQSGPVRLESIDLDGDGSNELLLFGDEPAVFGSIDVFRLIADRDQPLAIGPAAAAIDGATTLAEVRARLPLTAPLDETTLAAASTAAIVGRLALASVSDLRAMTSMKGVELCVSVGVNFEGYQTSCRTVAGRKLTDSVLKDEVQDALLRSLDPTMIMGFECSKEKRASCTAGLSGATSVTIELEGEGATRRVVKITRSDAGIGE